MLAAHSTSYTSTHHSCRNDAGDNAEVVTLQYSSGDIYKGHVLGGHRQGRGLLTCLNGDIYSGSWHLDRRHGQGRLTLSNGLVYDGAWRNDMANGDGVCLYADGRRYEGEWVDDQRQGWGRMVTPEGDVYEGEWRDDQPHGMGHWTHADGSYFQGTFSKGLQVEGRFVSADGAFEYMGQFKDDLRDGTGSCIKTGLFKYSGGWRADLRHGTGTAKYVDGSRYEGSWQEDKRHGTGCLTRPDGYRYEGEWQEDMPHGTGKCWLETGDVYKGEWREGKRHGTGHCKFANGDSYHGDWQNDRRHGSGTCIYATGDKYKGQWQKGRRHGWGRIVFADGVHFEGQWEEDHWLQSTADPLLSRPSGPGLRKAVAGKNASFVIQARDELNNRRFTGGDAFCVKLTNARDASWELRAAVEDRGDGTYMVTYCTDSAGEMLLHITTGDGESVAASPYTVHVAADVPLPRRCFAVGPGRSRATCGQAASFLVIARDSFGNRCAALHLYTQLPIEVELHDGHALLPVTVQADDESGHYVCTYTPARASLCRLTITSGGTHISGSPYALVVCPSETDDDQSVVQQLSAVQLVDAVQHWGRIAEHQLSLEGGASDEDVDKPPLTAEELFIKEHPGVPVVERLEDMWKVSKVLQLRARDK